MHQHMTYFVNITGSLVSQCCCTRQVFSLYIDNWTDLDLEYQCLGRALVDLLELKLVFVIPREQVYTLSEHRLPCAR